MAFNASSEMQAARSHQRWAKPNVRAATGTRQARVQNKLSAAQVTAISAVFAKGIKQIQQELVSQGLSPTQLPVLSRVKRSNKSGAVLPAPIVPEVTAPLFARAKARMAQERGDDLPDGYWGRKQRFYFAAMEEQIESTTDDMYKIVGLAHLLKETGNMLRNRGEMAKLISEEESRQLEAEVRNMSDEELASDDE